MDFLIGVGCDSTGVLLEESGDDNDLVLADLSSIDDDDDDDDVVDKVDDSFSSK